jgi:hypothetical protein
MTRGLTSLSVDSPWTGPRPGAPATTGRNPRPRSGAGSRRDLEDTDTGRRRVAIASRWQPAGRP